MGVRYSFPVHRARNVFTALRLAKRLRDAGEFDIFRGQVENHALRPSALRRIDPTHVVYSLRDFYSWILQIPELASLHTDADLRLAVAQHYGLPTTLLDFTYDPEVAGFFACDGKPRQQSRSGSSTSCIVCGHSARITKSWAELNHRYRASKGFDLVRVLTVDVRNLWRLQAQRGLFLDVHVDPTLLEEFSGFLHIEFPWSADSRPVLDREMYPTNKSHLETLLDQYFLIADYKRREAQLLQIGPRIDAGAEGYLGDPTYFVRDRLPPRHASWDGLPEEWNVEPDERYAPSSRRTEIVIRINRAAAADSEFASVCAQLDQAQANGARLRHDVTWHVRDEDNRDVYVTGGPGVESARAGEMVGRLFDGMRSKPYTSTNVIRSIALYAVMSSHGGWDTMRVMFTEIAGVEFEGGFTRARGFADARSILSAVREDLFEHVKPEKVKQVRAGGADGILGILVDPARLFVFERFCELFVEQALPTAALAMIEGKVLPFNAARIKRFGLS